MHPGQDGPVKEPLAFGALTLTEPLPGAGAQVVGSDPANIAEQAASWRLYTDHLGARDRQSVGVALLLQGMPQVGAMAVDRISYDPADGQAS